MKTAKITLLTAAAAAFLALGGAAQAATQVCPGGGCQPNPDSNVQFIDNSQGTTIDATLNNSPALITFVSNETLQTQANGQATLFAADGTINTSTFVDIFSTTNLITALELNLDAATAGTATFTFFGGDSGGVAETEILLASGSNFFNAFGGSFERVRITLGDGATLSDINQVRLTAGPGLVPEPATWAMMMLGFGAVGYSMRRRRVAVGKLQAI
jgi:hypothetical protein